VAGLISAFAGLRAAYAGLREADAAIRSRDRPGGALMGLSAYLVGFAVIRTAANSYIYFSSLRGLVPREDAYALAVIGAAIACGPLVAALVLSRGRPGDRRLAHGPAVTSLPTILLASALPVIAASPMAAWSLADYIVTAAWFPATAAALSLGVRSLAGAAAGIAGSGGAVRLGHGRAVALAGALLGLAAANPTPTAEGGRAILSIFGAKLTADLLVRVSVAPPFPTENRGLATAALAFAGLTALAADAPARRLRTAGSAKRPAGRRVGLSALWPMAAVADRKHDAAWNLAACLALAAAAVAQGAAPRIPLAAAAAVFVVRSGSALAFIATDSGTTRRFARTPAKPGAADRAYIMAAMALAAAISAPLVAASAASAALALR
jgi:hypothetical protein